jgi:hypothetical protein
MGTGQANQSGGVNLAAAEVNVGGDLVGRDKIISAGGDVVAGHKYEVTVVTGGNAYINVHVGQPQITRRPPMTQPLAQPIDFTARSAEASQLEQLIRHRQPVVIYGPDGVGKTLSRAKWNVHKSSVQNVHFFAVEMSTGRCHVGLSNEPQVNRGSRRAALGVE